MSWLTPIIRLIHPEAKPSEDMLNLAHKIDERKSDIVADMAMITIAKDMGQKR